MVKMGKASCSVPLVLVLLAFLSCLFLAHGLYGLIELFGSPDLLSPEATLLISALCFLVLAAAVAGGSRKMLLSREGDLAAVVVSGGAQEVPTTPDQEVAAGADLPLLLADDEEMMVTRRVDLQTEDYPRPGPTVAMIHGTRIKILVLWPACTISAWHQAY
ncbi:hypothetical protein ACQ4PT_050570 [Festuca glaucescens]